MSTCAYTVWGAAERLTTLLPASVLGQPRPRQGPSGARSRRRLTRPLAAARIARTRVS